MADPSAADRALLDRLNALRPSSVTLDKAQNAPNTSREAVSVSSEDALSARLRTLRNQPEGAASAAPQGSSAATIPPQPPPASSSSTAVPREKLPSGPAAIAGRQDGAEVDDALGFADETALHEFLAGLDVHEDDYQWRSLDHPHPLPASGRKFRGAAAGLGSLRRKGGGDDGEGRHDDSDDSEGDAMSREVARVLARARDELAAEQGREDAAGPEAVDGRADSPGRGEGPLVLPTVPGSRPVGRLPAGTDGDGDGDGDGDEAARKSADFDAGMAARLAALQRLGGGGSDDGPLSLPSVPTFRPEDGPAVPPFAVVKKTAYTDEDRKSWCVVCLDDATVSCTGCDGDGYCARCWRDMHRGPAAAFDERGHERVSFSK